MKLNRNLRLSENDTIAGALSCSDKRFLRLVTVFKSVANILYQDLIKYPWKMVFYSGPIPGAGWTCGTLTCLFYASGLTSNGRKHRSNFVKAIKDPIHYKLYTDFMAIDHGNPQKIHLHRSKIIKYARSQGGGYLLRQLEKQVANMNESCLKKWLSTQVRKRISKGELVLVS